MKINLDWKKYRAIHYFTISRVIIIFAYSRKLFMGTFCGIVSLEMETVANDWLASVGNWKWQKNPYSLLSFLGHARSNYSGRKGQKLVTVDMLQDLPMHWSHALAITSEVHISFHIIRYSCLQQVYNQLKEFCMVLHLGNNSAFIAIYWFFIYHVVLLEWISLLINECYLFVLM